MIQIEPDEQPGNIEKSTLKIVRKEKQWKLIEKS
jgi:hypothetical protein